MFTKPQLDVLFHIVNNSCDKCFEEAMARAAVVDGLSREAFIEEHAQVLRILQNPEVSA